MNAPEPLTPPANATAVALLPIAEIVASASNPRKHFDDTYLAELADSIRSHGLIQPITVRPLSFEAMLAYNKHRGAGDDSAPRYELVVGECRWRAAKQAGLTDIPAFWRELDDKQVLEIQVIENLQRRDVHEIEEAEGYQALIARHGYTADQIAAKIGKSRSYVYGRLKFTALCRDVRESFFAGKLDGSTALLIARIPGEALQKKAAKEVINGYNGEPLSHRAAKQHIHSRYTLSLKQATFAPDDATLLPAAGACSACPKLSGNFHDLFNDIEAADVCTDPDCFEAKRLARRDRLIVNAEKRKIPVYLGDQARETLRHDITYVSLDAEVDDDAEGRTYRQILGDKAPVAAVIERQYGLKELDECGDLTALERALKKAGWKPAEEAPTPAPVTETPEQAAAREADFAERRKQQERRAELEQLALDEETRRKEALAAVVTKLHALTLDTDKTTENLFHLVAEAWLRNLFSMNELSDLEDGIREHLDANYRLPDEFDDTEEIPRAVETLRQTPLARVAAFLISDMVANDECHVNQWHLDEDRHALAAPHILAPLTRLLDVPFQSLTHPASTPTEAAPAGDQGRAAKAKAEAPKKPAAKKAKAKADPAPASPANEAAAPPKPARDPWPFPMERNV